MFTGIIESLGTLEEKAKDRLKIAAPASIIKEFKIGSSIALDGACFTVVQKSKTTFSVVFMPESERRTLLSTYKKGSKINLELPLKVSGRLDGHFVLGHVERTAILKVIRSEKNSTLLTLEAPKSLIKYIVPKGSVTLNGVALTVIEKKGALFSVGIIPHTWKATNLHFLKVGQPLNLETDMIAKYIESIFNK